MTSNSVRDGASPRDPKTAKAEPTPAQVPAKPAPAADWLAPVEPERTPASDWLAPVAPSQPPARPEPEFEPDLDDLESDLEPDLEPDLERSPGSPLHLAGEDDDGDFDDFEDEDLDEASTDEPELTLIQRLRRISPAVVLLGLAAAASLGALLAQLVSHTSPIPLLTSLAVVTGMIYAAIGIVAGVGAYHSATAGHGRVSYLLAFVGGGAAIVACGSFAGATLLVLALGL